MMENLGNTERSLNENMIEAALEYLKLGYKPIPLPPGSKGKGMTFKWKRLQQETPTEAEILSWFGSGSPNIALVTGNGLVVVDVDDPALLGDVVAHCGDTPMRCQTPSGGQHLYFGMRKGVRYGNAVRMNGRPIDLRCEGAYVVSPWSRTEKGKYEWLGPVVPVADLPVVKISWLRERKPKRNLKPVVASDNVHQMIRRARGYLATIGPIERCEGKCHNIRMRIAGILTQKFGLSVDAAIPLFQEWNSHCSKPASDGALLHKLNDAVRLRMAKGLTKIS